MDNQEIACRPSEIKDLHSTAGYKYNNNNYNNLLAVAYGKVALKISLMF